jgi:hypothetical protein
MFNVKILEIQKIIKSMRRRKSKGLYRIAKIIKGYIMSEGNCP